MAISLQRKTVSPALHTQDVGTAGRVDHTLVWNTWPVTSAYTGEDPHTGITRSTWQAGPKAANPNAREMALPSWPGVGISRDIPGSVVPRRTGVGEPWGPGIPADRKNVPSIAAQGPCPCTWMGRTPLLPLLKSRGPIVFVPRRKSWEVRRTDVTFFQGRMRVLLGSSASGWESGARERGGGRVFPAPGLYRHQSPLRRKAPVRCHWLRWPRVASAKSEVGG